MIEIEIRARIKKSEPIISRLKNLGGKFIKKERQIDRVFGRPIDLDKDKMVIEGQFSARIRERGNKKSVEFKEICRAGSGMEFSSAIGDAKCGINFLKKIDYEEAFTVDKIRELYNFKDFEICIDKIRLLGNFIEIEHPVKTGKKRGEAIEECKNILKIIAPEAKLENRKYGDLMQELINKKKK